MAVTEVLARGFTFELNTGTEGAPTWVAIGGAKSWAHSPSANDADTTDFDDEGRMAHMKASRGDEFTITCNYQEDEDDGTRDAGQEAAEAWAEEVGPSSRKQFRITSPGGTVKTFYATATVKNGGGGNDDPNAWELTTKVSGSIATA